LPAAGRIQTYQSFAPAGIVCEQVILAVPSGTVKRHVTVHDAGCGLGLLLFTMTAVLSSDSAHVKAAAGDAVASVANMSGKTKPRTTPLASLNRRYALAGRQFTKNTPTTQTAMPTSASGASFSPNSANAISAVTGGVR
jgi:hypothetical protein